MPAAAAAVQAEPTPAYACQLVKPYRSTDPLRADKIGSAWVQDFAGRTAVMATDGSAAAWAWTKIPFRMSGAPGNYMTDDGEVVGRELEDLTRTPDVLSAFPQAIAGVDVTELIREAVTTARGLPKANRTRKPEKRPAREDVCHVVHIALLPDTAEIASYVTTRPLGSGTPSSIMLYAHYVANIPGNIVRASFYPWHHSVLIETDLGGALIMCRRAV